MNPQLWMEPAVLGDEELLRAVWGQAVPSEVLTDFMAGMPLEGAPARGWPAELCGRLLAGRELWKRHRRRLETSRPTLTGAEDVAQYASDLVGDRMVEVFLVIALDVRLRPLAVFEASRGTLTSSLVHPREVFRGVVLSGAHSLIVVHNHPSGDPEPSEADRVVTTRLDQVGQILGVPLIDHVILGRDRYVSMALRGYVPGAHRVSSQAGGTESPLVTPAASPPTGAGGAPGSDPPRPRRTRVRTNPPCGPGLGYWLGGTERGTFAFVFRAGRLEQVLFPQARAEDVCAEVARRCPTAGPCSLPAELEGAACALRRYLDEGEGDPAGCPVPFAHDGIPAFHREIYAALRQVGRGTTVTYGELAKRAGRPLAARAVGQAMRRNPWPILVPCHRVVGSSGGMGGFSAPGGLASKERLLTLEGAIAPRAPRAGSGPA